MASAAETDKKTQKKPSAHTLHCTCSQHCASVVQELLSPSVLRLKHTASHCTLLQLNVSKATCKDAPKATVGHVANR